MVRATTWNRLTDKRSACTFFKMSTKYALTTFLVLGIRYSIDLFIVRWRLVYPELRIFAELCMKHLVGTRRRQSTSEQHRRQSQIALGLQLAILDVSFASGTAFSLTNTPRPCVLPSVSRVRMRDGLKRRSPSVVRTRRQLQTDSDVDGATISTQQTPQFPAG